MSPCFPLLATRAREDAHPRLARRVTGGSGPGVHGWGPLFSRASSVSSARVACALLVALAPPALACGTDAGTTGAATALSPGEPSRDAAPDDRDGRSNSAGPSAFDAGVVDAARADATDSSAPPWVVGQPFPIEGFGAGTKGGFQSGHDVYHVTSLADAGPGSLRAGLATSDAPRVIVFDLDGDIMLTSALVLPANLTIDGRGRRVTVRNKGFVVPGKSEIILVNLAIAGVFPASEDGIQIGHPTNGPSEHVVLDHVSFLQTGSAGDSKNVDEAVSVIFGSRLVTIAWCRFERWEKVMLFGNGDAPAATDAAIRVTVHHSYGLETGRRHPQARYGFFDFYDNEWDDWHMFGWAFESPYRESFGAQAQDGARLLVESQIFRRHAVAFDALSQANDATRCESGGVLDERGSWTPPDSTAPLVHRAGCPALAAPLVRPYPAIVDPAGPALRTSLETKTGNVLF